MHTTCTTCGNRWGPCALSEDDQRFACPCGATIILRGLRTNAAALQRRPFAPVSAAELERLGKAHIGLRTAFEEVRPTAALLERCYEALRRHGIAWER